jgi:hypothetical protein
MAILAAASLERSASERDYRVSAAKAYCGEAARFVAEQAIQLHGAMGMTEECQVSRYARHLIMFDHHLGDVDHHLELVSEQLHGGLSPTPHFTVMPKALLGSGPFAFQEVREQTSGYSLLSSSGRISNRSATSP